MEEKYIDLHVHSTNSDGALTPDKVIEETQKNNVDILSITDHDITPDRSFYESLTIGNESIRLIPGAELSTDYYIEKRKIRIHILAYDAIDKDGLLRKELKRLKEARTEGNYIYIKMLLKKLTFLDAEDFKDFDYSQYGWIKKRILTQINPSKYTEEEFNILLRCLNEIKPKYPKCTFELEEGIGLVKDANGYTSFAHPYQTGLKYDELLKLIDKMKVYGLDSIETFHAEAKIDDNKTAKSLANKYRLLESCGSDFHRCGQNKIGYGINNNMKITETSLSNYIIEKGKYFMNGIYRGEDDYER